MLTQNSCGPRFFEFNDFVCAIDIASPNEIVGFVKFHQIFPLNQTKSSLLFLCSF